MDTVDMLIEAQSASAASAAMNSGEESAGTCGTDDRSPTIGTMTLEELDIGGSEFSWSSVGSRPSQPGPDAPTVTFEGIFGEEVAVAKTPTWNQPTVSMGTPAEHAPAPSMQKHSLYFWESITFKVEGVIFQLPKYRFVEDSGVFMDMVQASKEDGVVELDVALVEFESFLKAFLPRTLTVYENRVQLTKDEWVSALKLSTLWLFNDLRKFAISELDWQITDPIERISLAKEYNVYSWLLKGCEDVIWRLLSFNDPDGEPMTLTAQEGQRIGMDVALALSGIAIRRMRLAERAPLRDVTSDVVDVFKQEFDCVREEGARFFTRSERLEEARWKAEEEVREKAKVEAQAKRMAEAEQEKKWKEMEDKAAQRVLEEEAEKQRAFKEEERKKEAEMETKRQQEEAKDETQAEEVETLRYIEWYSLNFPSNGSKRLLGRARVREVVEEETRRIFAGKGKRLEEMEMSGSGVVNAWRSEAVDFIEWRKIINMRLWEEERQKRERRSEEEERKKEEEGRKRKDADARKLRVLVEEELSRRKALAEEKAKEENNS
ncbi:hypothetical protein BKA70DRAFT_1570756 [Coprinopsis sp. MPI-PUGE-AT-0042]|nr:hypothetical protein BKA70DRAFT_1570756 [Coprinopsis sp. MPI-PUGE-AT-0042]